MRSLATLLLFLSLFSARPARAQAPTYNFTPLTQLLQDSLARLGGRAGLLLIQNGQVIYKQYFGGWNDNTTIPIASGSKLPSMAAVLTLVDEGRLNLDDVVTKYLPQSFAAKPAITLRQLMSHTSGLPGGSRFLETNTLTLAQAVDSIGRRAPMSRYAPGTAFQYGGVSMHVAGRLAEIAAGESWDALFARRIAGPLNMPNTDYLGLGPTTNFRIAGGAQTRMPEYAHLLQMLLDDGLYNGQRVLSPAAVRAMLSDQTAGVPLVGTPYQNDPRRQNFRYGFGAWLERLNPDNGLPTEFGDQGAFGFSPWLDKCRNLAGVFFVQRTLRSVQPTYTRVRQLVSSIVAVQLPAVSISQAGSVLSSSVATGNQWYLSGTALAGATGAQYQPTQPGSYTVRVTYAGNCTTTSAPVAVTALATGAAPVAGGWLAFPNPAADQLTVQVPPALASAGLVHAQAYSAEGRRVAELPVLGRRAEQWAFSVAPLAAGLYTLRLSVAGQPPAFVRLAVQH